MGTRKLEDLCAWQHAGSIKYPSLPGSIKTGCTRSPKFKSRFCEHETKSYIGNPQYLSDNHIEDRNPTKHHPSQLKVRLWSYFLRKNLHAMGHIIGYEAFYAIICVVS